MKKCLSTLIMFFSLLSCYTESDIYNILDFGTNSDGKTLTTASIQKAIDACAITGGGMVYVSKGDIIVACERVQKF